LTAIKEEIRKEGADVWKRILLFLLLKVKKKGKVIPLHAMEAHGVRGGIAPAHS
jgi:hypothetical protein